MTDANQSDAVVVLAAALAPFARVAAINAPLSASWPDDKPNREFVPSGWPDWGDFKRALAALDEVCPEWRDLDSKPEPGAGGGKG